MIIDEMFRCVIGKSVKLTIGSQRTFTLSLTVSLVSRVTGLDSTKQENVFIFVCG